MITRRLRPFTDAKRADAAAYADYLRRETAAHSGVAPLVTPTVLGVLRGLFGAVLVAGLMQRAGFPEPVWKATLLLVATGGAVLGLRAAERARDAAREPFASLLAAWLPMQDAGLIEETQVAALACARLGDGNEPAYFFETADGRTVFFGGWYLADAVESGAFPCDRFTVARFPGQEEGHAVACSGAPLVPVRSLVYESLPSGYIPRDGEALTASLATLEADLLRRHAGGRRRDA